MKPAVGDVNYQVIPSVGWVFLPVKMKPAVGDVIVTEDTRERPLNTKLKACGRLDLYVVTYNSVECTHSTTQTHTRHKHLMIVIINS